MDDVMQVVRKGCEQELTEHLNNITCSIKFTYEEESDNSLPFLDTFIIRTEDGTVKLLVYREKTHTDEYLNFPSHHALRHKLGVIKTLLDRCNNIVSEPEDNDKGMEHITKALERCILDHNEDEGTTKGKNQGEDRKEHR